MTATRLITAWDTRRLRIYLDADGTILGEVEARPEDASLPDGEYLADDDGTLTRAQVRRLYNPDALEMGQQAEGIADGSIEVVRDDSARRGLH